MTWGETYPHHNLYFIESEIWNLEIPGGLLMPGVGRFFVASYGVRMRGRYWRDRAEATRVALEIYRIDKREMEMALGP